MSIRRDWRSLSPVVIGGTGGSGTRAFVQVLRATGMAFGRRNLNRKADAMVFLPFYDRWIDPLVLEWQGRRPMDERDRARIARALRRAVRSYLRDARPRAGQVWGWKNPRTIHLVPFLHAMFPRMRYLHVVRDPRDMAFSRQFKMLHHGHHRGLYLSAEEEELPDHRWLALLWKRTNNPVRDYGVERLGPAQYLLMRYEDVCTDPREATVRLTTFAGLEPTAEQLATAAGMVTASSSIGRWRRQDPTLQDEVERILKGEIVEYGYARADAR